MFTENNNHQPIQPVVSHNMQGTHRVHQCSQSKYNWLVKHETPSYDQPPTSTPRGDERTSADLNLAIQPLPSPPA